VEQVNNFPESAANVTLYIGFKGDPRPALKVRGENHWIYEGYDHDDLYARRMNFWPVTAALLFCLSFA